MMKEIISWARPCQGEPPLADPHEGWGDGGLTPPATRLAEPIQHAGHRVQPEDFVTQREAMPLPDPQGSVDLVPNSVKFEH